MKTSRYLAVATGFCALLATTYLFSQTGVDKVGLYSSLYAAPATDTAAGESQHSFCFNGEFEMVSCEYELMLGASGNAGDVHHVEIK
jgi:hypothetical protein